MKPSFPSVNASFLSFKHIEFCYLKPDSVCGFILHIGSYLFLFFSFFFLAFCRPFYLPRKLTVARVTTVYISPSANISSPLNHLQLIIIKQQRKRPEGDHIVVGHFHKACLKSVLPKFHQHVKFLTRGDRKLDHAYSNNKQASKVTPLAHLGQSDHLSLLLIPAHIPVR